MALCHPDARTGTASCTRNAIRGGREQGMEWTLVVELETEWSRRTAIHATSHRTLAGCILHSFSSRRPAPLPCLLSPSLLRFQPTYSVPVPLPSSHSHSPSSPLHKPPHCFLPPSTPHESNVPSSRIPQRHACIGMPPPHPHCPLLSSSSAAAAAPAA